MMTPETIQTLHRPNYENQEKNLMKYLKPEKHMYRIAYADPHEHTKRAQNLRLPPPIESSLLRAPTISDEKSLSQF